MDNNANMMQLCRLCLVKDEVNIPIFEEQGDIRQIFLKISSCLPVKVSREDKLPKKICDGCSYKLDMLYEFWNTSANAEKQLLSWLGEAGMSAKMNDGHMSAVAQQIKPNEALVKEEELDPSDLQKEEEDDDDDEEKSYMFQQKLEENNAGPSVTATSNEEEEQEPPPPKRARRTAAVKAAIAMDHDSDDDDDSGEPLTKIEDESEESDCEDAEPAFVDAPSTSADDQAGPSGVGKDGADAPWKPNKPRSKSNRRTCNSNRYAKTTNTKQNSKVVKAGPVKLEQDVCENGDVEKRERRGRKPLHPEHEYMDKFINLNAITQPLECKSCSKTFQAHLDLGLHSKSHSKEDMYSCHLCDFKKDVKALFKNHILSHDLYKCKKCSKIFKSKRCAYKHSKTHSVQIFVQCEICGKNVRSVYLDTHRKMVHSEESVNLFQCTLCDKSYKNSTALKGHYSFNHKEFGIDTSVICNICGLRLSCKGKLGQHIRTHTGDKPFPCTICLKKFISKDILTSHMRVHTGEKPYLCMYCGKKFAHGAPYRYHIKTHTGEKPCTCPICGKGFISKANMRIHLKSCMFPIK